MHGKIVALPAIEKPQPEKIAAEEPPRRPQREGEEAGCGLPGGPLAHKLVAERDDLLQSLIDRLRAEMVQVTLELAHRPVHVQVRMRIDAHPARASSPPEPGLPVGIPIPVPDPSS